MKNVTMMVGKPLFGDQLWYQTSLGQVPTILCTITARLKVIYSPFLLGILLVRRKKILSVTELLVQFLCS
jgi:hypothetical protein